AEPDQRELVFQEDVRGELPRAPGDLDLPAFDDTWKRSNARLDEVAGRGGADAHGSTLTRGSTTAYPMSTSRLPTTVAMATIVVTPRSTGKSRRCAASQNRSPMPG